MKSGERVAALYVQVGGVYYELPNVDPWDEARDARNYAGPHPVVAHPPCNLWTNMTRLNFKRYGGAHNIPANDGGKFAHALACVKMFGGVLEHPARSWAWPAFGLSKPQDIGWSVCPSSHNAWVCEVCQSNYGHKAQKKTWLYYVGPKPPDLNWRKTSGTHQCGWFDRIKPTLSKKDAAATPRSFADALIDLAMRSSSNQSDKGGDDEKR